MPKRIPTMSIVMHIDGKRQVLKPGKTYELTTAQIKEIEATGGKDALRKTVNEEETVTNVNLGGVVNAGDSAANLDASVPAPKGAATSPTTGTGKNPAPAKAGSKADPKVGDDDL